MKVEFPQQLVPLNPNPKFATKNAADQTTRLLPGDVIYILDAIQRVIGITNSDDTVSHDYRIRQLELLVQQLEDSIGSGETAVPDEILAVLAGDIFATTAVVLWITSNAATSAIDYGLDTTYGTTVTDSTMVKVHLFTLTGLDTELKYHFQVRSTPSSGVEMTSGDYEFPNWPDTHAVADADVAADNREAGQTTIVWKTDSPGTSQVLYGLTPALGSSTSIDTTNTTFHKITIMGLSVDTTYFFQVKSTRDVGTTTLIALSSVQQLTVSRERLIEVGTLTFARAFLIVAIDKILNRYGNLGFATETDQTTTPDSDNGGLTYVRTRLTSAAGPDKTLSRNSTSLTTEITTSVA